MSPSLSHYLFVQPWCPPIAVHRTDTKNISCSETPLIKCLFWNLDFKRQIFPANNEQRRTAHLACPTDQPHLSSTESHQHLGMGHLLHPTPNPHSSLQSLNHIGVSSHWLRGTPSNKTQINLEDCHKCSSKSHRETLLKSSKQSTEGTCYRMSKPVFCWPQLRKRCN